MSDLPATHATREKSQRLAYKFFRGTFSTWDDLFGEAAQFATEIGPEHVVNISHSVNHGDGVVTVWYWSEANDETNA